MNFCSLSRKINVVAMYIRQTMISFNCQFLTKTGLHMWASASQGLSSISPKQWKSDGHVKIYNSVSVRLPQTKSKKKNYRERSTLQSEHVSALTAEELQSVSALIRNPTQIARLTATCLNH